MARALGVGLVVLFFLLIPGLAGLKAFLHTFVRLDSLSRIDKLSLGVVIGGLLLGATLFALNWDCWSGNFAAVFTDAPLPEFPAWGTEGAWCDDGNAATIETVRSTPLLVVLGVVAVESSVAVVLCGAAGWALNRWSDGPPREPKYIEQPWEHASRKTVRETEPATVITTGGEEITGRIHRIGAPSADYDLLLKDPEKVVRDDLDREVTSRELGSYSYHHYRDISQIHFHTLGDDPSTTDEEPGGDGDEGDGEGPRAADDSVGTDDSPSPETYEFSTPEERQTTGEEDAETGDASDADSEE